MAARKSRIDAEEEQRGIRIGGRAIYYDPPLPPKVLDEEGKALVDRGARALENGDRKCGEDDLRTGIENLVDAFLLDRIGCSSAFTVAHQIGAFVSKSFGCQMKSDDGASWRAECGIWALHSRLGSSYGATTQGHCSICSADDLECDHIPGQSYEDEVCVRIVHRVDLNEISVVPFPEDPRTYRLEASRTVSEIEGLSGETAQPRAVPICTHCEICPGIPTAEDLDQTLWEVSVDP
jgi:hypothetical protein